MAAAAVVGAGDAIAEMDDPGVSWIARMGRRRPIGACLGISKPCDINSWTCPFVNKPYQLIFSWQAPVAVATQARGIDAGHIGAGFTKAHVTEVGVRIAAGAFATEWFTLPSQPCAFVFDAVGNGVTIDSAVAVGI